MVEQWWRADGDYVNESGDRMEQTTLSPHLSRRVRWSRAGGQYQLSGPASGDAAGHLWVLQVMPMMSPQRKTCLIVRPLDP